MNADSAVSSFMCRLANAMADSIPGGYPANLLAKQVLWQARAIGLRNGGTIEFICGAPLGTTTIESFGLILDPIRRKGGPLPMVLMKR